MLVYGEGDTARSARSAAPGSTSSSGPSEIGAAFAHYGGDRRTRTLHRRGAGRRSPTSTAWAAATGVPADRRAARRTTPTPRPRRCAPRRSSWAPAGARRDLPPAAVRRPVARGARAASARRSGSRTGPTSSRTPTTAIANLLPALGRRQGPGRPGRRQAGDDDQRGRPVPEVPHRHEDRAAATPVRTSRRSGPARRWSSARAGRRGTWRKARRCRPDAVLLDAAGNEIPLVRGRTFIQVVPPRPR